MTTATKAPGLPGATGAAPRASRISLPGRLFDAHEDVGRRLASTVEPVFNLGVRLWMAKIFFDSGLVRVNSWAKQPELFEKFHPVPGIPPALAAYVTTVAELVLPALLVLGLFTRLPALGMLVMAMVIEFVSARTPEGIEAGIGNPQHVLWMLLLGYLFIRGGGPLSADGLITRRRA